MSPQTYQLLPLANLSSNSPTLPHTHRPKPNPSKTLPLTPTLFTLLPLLALLLGYLSTTPSPPTPPTLKFGTHPNRSKTCGTTPTTARAAACTFDILTYAWQAPACYDRRLVEDYGELISWEFFPTTNDNNSSNAHAEPLSAKEVSTGERDVRAYWELHVRHCQFIFRRLLRGVRGGGCVDGKVGGYAHTVHCGLSLLDREMGARDLNTLAEVIYPDCPD